MTAEQLVLLPPEDKPLPQPLPPPVTAEVVLCMADLLIQVATDQPADTAAEEVGDELLR